MQLTRFSAVRIEFQNSHRQKERRAQRPAFLPTYTDELLLLMNYLAIASVTPACSANPAALSVFSHVKPSPLRPKWPYAAVALKIGLRRSRPSIMPFGVSEKFFRTSSSSVVSSTLPVPNVSTSTLTGSATPIA